MISWNENDLSFSDIHYRITKAGSLKWQSSNKRGFIEKLSEEEVIRLISLAAANNAFDIKFAKEKLFRQRVLSALAANCLPEGIMLTTNVMWQWSGVGMSPHIVFQLPQKGNVLMTWKSLKNFLAETERLTSIAECLKELYRIDKLDSDVSLLTGYKL